MGMIALSLYKPASGQSQTDEVRVLDPTGLFTYDPSGSSLPAALEQLQQEHRSIGLETAYFMSEHGWVARFVWPDWPPGVSHNVEAVVDRFHEDHAELTAIPAGTDEWKVLNRGWESDPNSAERIFECFGRSFPSKIEWTRAEKNSRGAIEAKCSIKERGVTSIHLSWRSFAAEPLWLYTNPDEIKAYQAAVRDVFAWARSRIQPILDTLREKLKTLYGDRFRGLYVFGSYARPDAGIQLPESSDLDVALILSDFESPFEERERYGDFVADLSLEHSLVISVKPIREADYKEGKTNFTRVISEYAIPV